MSDDKNKGDWNRKYTFIAIYSFIVIVASFAVILVILGIRDFFAQRQYTAFFKVLTPIIYGLVFAYLLNPLLMFLQKKVFFKMRGKVKNIISIAAAYLIMAVVITLLLLMIVPQVVSSMQQLTGKATDLLSPYEESDIANSKIGVYLANFGEGVQDYVDSIGLKIDVEKEFDGMYKNVFNLITSYITPAFNSIAAFVFGAASGALNILLGILISIYLLVSKDKFIAQIKKLLFAFLPSGFSYKLINIMRKTHEIFGGFLIGKILDSGIVGVICFIVMSIFNIRYTALISVIVAVTNIIPFFGPFIGAVPSLVFLAVNDIWQALWFLIFILILQQVDGNIIGPKILGPKVGLSSLWVIVSIIVMSGLFGIPGIFFGVPVFAVVYVLIKEYAENKLKAKGFPEETEQYIRQREDIGVNYKGSDGGKTKKESKVIKTGESKSFIYEKILHRAAKNIMGGFGLDKIRRKPPAQDDEEYEGSDDDEKNNSGGADNGQ